MGPYRTHALCGSRYFLTILDDYSQALWIYLFPSKQTAPTELKNFIALVERQFDKQVKTIRSDNGSEFLCLRDYFREKGIQYETSCIWTPQQNGKVERKHQHILNVARALRFQANLPIEFWGYCAITAGYLINRTPTPILHGKSPFELLYDSPPPLNHLRIFGCLCYVHNQKRDGDKFATRSHRSVFIGYPHGKKGWRTYNLDTGIVSVSRDVIFVETEFPFIVTTPPPSSGTLLQEPLVNTEDSEMIEAPSTEGILVSQNPQTMEPVTPIRQARSSSLPDHTPAHTPLPCSTPTSNSTR